MADVFTKSQRSRIMAAVRGEDTVPEMIVRRLVHGMGYRYRLHDSSLPGKPDLMFPSRRAAIFVHGCFWHRHACQKRRGRKLPVTNRAFWLRKLQRNVARDRRNIARLRRLGWRVMIVWECRVIAGPTTSTGNATAQARLASRLRRFLGKPRR